MNYWVIPTRGIQKTHLEINMSVSLQTPRQLVSIINSPDSDGIGFQVHASPRRVFMLIESQLSKLHA